MSGHFCESCGMPLCDHCSMPLMQESERELGRCMNCEARRARTETGTWGYCPRCNRRPRAVIAWEDVKGVEHRKLANWCHECMPGIAPNVPPALARECKHGVPISDYGSVVCATCHLEAEIARLPAAAPLAAPEEPRGEA